MVERQKIASPIPAVLSQSQLPIQRPDAAVFEDECIPSTNANKRYCTLAAQYIPILLTIIYI